MKSLFLSAMILVLTALPLSAQQGPTRGARAEHIAGFLKLSEAQQASIRALRGKSRPAMVLQMETLKQTRMALRGALADATTTDAQLRSLHDKASAAQFDLMLSRRAVRGEVQALLTPEQRTKAAELRALAKASRQQRMIRIHRALGKAD